MNTASAFLSFLWVVLFARPFLAVVADDYKRYDEYKIYRVIVTTEEQLNLLQTLEEQSGNGVSFWRLPRPVHKYVDLMISPEQAANILSVFENYDLSYEILTEDLQTWIDNGNLDGNMTSINWTAYHRLGTIYDWLDELAETHPDRVEIIVIGSSYEGRLLKGIKITFQEDNPAIFFEGGLHAREWISPAVVTYMINEILNPTNVEFQLFAEMYNWYIFPVTNPDGYEYSHTTDRLWRKTRRPYANNCFGADPNRNWDYYWLSNDGASNDSCSIVYAGPEPFSEVEIKALADYIASVSSQLCMYLSIHSPGQDILLPYGYTAEHLDNFDVALEIGLKAAEALAKRYGTHFDVGATSEIYYFDCGSSTDYVKGIFNTSIVYCYELRDNGTYLWLLPPEQIIPSSLEFIDSLTELMKDARSLCTP